MPVLVALGVLAGVIFGAGIGSAHDRIAAPAPTIESPQDAADLDVLTRQLLDGRLSTDERLHIAALRRNRLAALMERSPAQVLKHAVAAGARAALAPNLQALVEAEESHDGTLQVLHADRAQGEGSYYYNLRKTGGEWLALRFAGSQPVLSTGAHVRVRGMRVQQALALGDSGAVTVLAEPAEFSTFGEHRTMVILVNFMDAPNASTPTLAEVRSLMFGPGGVSDFYRETSYQHAWLTGDVSGPFVVASTTAECDYNLIASLAQSAAGVAPGQYQNFVYAFSGSVCPWWGIGTVGGSPGQAWINGPLRSIVLAHELGHTFGLYHSHALECGSVTFGDACSSIEYGDFFDTMGSTSQSHFNAVQKEILGWLGYGVSPPLTQVLASGTYTIDPLEPAGRNPKALKVQTSLGDWFYVEYRRPMGFDTIAVNGDANVTNGVLVHYWNGQGNGVYLLDMTPSTDSWMDPALGVGNTFSDPAGGVSITPLWVNGTTAGVNVYIAALCARATPTLTMTPAQQQGSPGAPLTYTVSVASTDTGCGTSSFVLQATAPSGWTAKLGATSFPLADSGTASTTLVVTPPAAAAAGTYALSVTVSDQGLSASASASYVVVVIPTLSFADSFDRADSPALGNGWSVVSGGLKIVSGEARNETARTMHMAVRRELVGAAQTAAAKFATMDNNLGPQFGVVLRYQDAANHYRCYRSTGQSSVVRIARVVRGVETVLKAVSISNPWKDTFFTVSCQASGGTLTVLINGVIWYSVNDTTFASGSPGFMMGYVTASGTGMSNRANDFSATVK